MVENENSGRRILLDSFQDQSAFYAHFFFIIIYIVVNKQKSHLLSKKT